MFKTTPVLKVREDDDLWELDEPLAYVTPDADDVG